MTCNLIRRDVWSSTNGESTCYAKEYEDSLLGRMRGPEQNLLNVEAVHISSAACECCGGVKRAGVLRAKSLPVKTCNDVFKYSGSPSSSRSTATAKPRWRRSRRS